MATAPARWIGFASLCLLLFAVVAEAQELEVRVGREPYYLGVPIDIEVHSEGFERQPEPECSAEPNRGGALTLQGISPNISSSLKIVNGQVFRSESVRFTCHFRFVANEAGLLPIGPFVMSQGGVEKRTPPYKVEVREVPLDGRMKVRIRVPNEPVYLGQRVAIEIEWWLSGGLEDRIQNYVIRSPLFEMDDRVRFVDDQTAQRGDQTLILDTPGGELRLKATAERRREGETDYLVLRSQRTMIPLRAGDYQLGAAHVQAEEITRYSRDLFGRRTAAGTRRLLARDLARTLHVAPPPAAGKPDSFAGAVGRGFSFEVSADRSVVQVGDPIVLQLALSGDGNMATIGLPKLAGEGGLDPEQFRLPDGDVFGDVSGDRKSFEIAVRVLDESVDEIPALSYSWFDPETRRYETTQSRPIALSVRPAQVVAAADVVSATRATEGDEGGAETRTANAADLPRPPGARSAFALEGADLSIERDVSVLRGSRRPVWQLSAAVYGSSLALLAGAVFFRRRADIDPVILRRREALASARKRVAAAKTLSGSEGLAELAGGLREALAAIPNARSEETESFLQQCEDALYAPGGITGDADPALHARAESLLETIEEGA
jgi:hypothetical protein